MKVILSTDGTFGEVIDLKPYVRPHAREKIAELYRLHGWEFEPPDAWLWRFEDVCALYFRAARHRDVFGDFPASELVLCSIESAIEDCLQDEFA
jgi:hypothetical protein